MPGKFVTNIYLFIVRTKIVNRPANSGCEGDLCISHLILNRSFWPSESRGSTRDVTGKDGECFEFRRAFTGWKWTNYTFAVLYVFTKQLREQKMYVLRVFILFKPLYPKVCIHIPHTVLYTFVMVLTRRTCRSFPLPSWP